MTWLGYYLIVTLLRRQTAAYSSLTFFSSFMLVPAMRSPANTLVN